MAYGAVVNLKINIEKLLINSGPLFGPPSLKLLESARKEVRSFEEFHKGLGSNRRERMKASLGRITEAISEFSDVLGSLFFDQLFSQPEVEEGELISLEVESLEQEFHVIFEMMKKIKKEARLNGDADFGGNKRNMVGLSDVYNKLKQEIVVIPEDEYDSYVFLIVGMAGIGKTAVAKAIFQDLDMLEWFEYRVWVSVGKNCRPEEIPRRILAQLEPESAQNLGEGDGVVASYFEEILKGKRCLIVLDDVWDAGVYRHLVSFLPDDREGCRIILTSRSRRVAEHVEFISEMRLLNEKESWILLREKLFGEKSCSLELEKVGKKIANLCDGLPLTIITVANLLLKIPESHWIDVATQRKHQLFVDAYHEISKVLYPSYEDLPHRLKLCFLYMGVFPPNYKIHRSRLINMWFVEGLLQSNKIKSSEECADECLEEFSANSLVMVYQKRIRPSSSILTQDIKSCGLHSSWWHLCYTEARKDDFFYVLTSREDRLGDDIKSQSRLSIHNNVLFAIKDVYDSIEKNSESTASSLLCLGPYHRYPVSICFGLRFLKNIDALSIRMYEFPLEVLNLDGLKYFALTCDGELPHSISKIQNLQFFIVRRHHNIKLHEAPSYMPVEIWDMKEMKHLQITGSDLPDHHCGSILPNLSTLLDVSDHSCTKGIFERIPHLYRLGIRIELALDAAEPLHCFDHLSQLNDLEILKCVVVNPVGSKFCVVSLPTSLSIFPLGLKKLTMSGLGYPWIEIRKIASLPYLEVLKLRCNAFQGPEWEVEEDEFSMLKSLVIEDADLVEWNAWPGSFEKLKSISIKHCYKLKKVCWEFGVELLSKIEVVDCNPSLEYVIREALLRRQYIPDNFSVHSSWEEDEEDLKS